MLSFYFSLPQKKNYPKNFPQTFPEKFMRKNISPKISWGKVLQNFLPQTFLGVTSL